MVFRKITRTLENLLLAGIAAATFSCGDYKGNGSDADVGSDIGDEETGVFYEGINCELPQEVIDSYLDGEPLQEDAYLNPELDQTIEAGARIIGFRSPFMYVYSPDNPSQCIRNNLLREDELIAATEECSCEPAIYHCDSISSSWVFLPPVGWYGGEKFPLPEACNGLDDNCNLIVDDGFEPDVAFRCTPSEWEELDYDIVLSEDDKKSPCEPGVQYCVDGSFTDCSDYTGPSEENCNGLDDDCNGLNDDREYWGVCGLDVGECALGRNEFHCVFGDIEGYDLTCIEEVGAVPETCDRLDNDCDGRRDNGIYRPCTTACGVGIETCVNGTFVGCTTEPTDELCGDNIDNDCDGEVDENCTCIPGLIRECQLYAELEVPDEITGDIIYTECGFGEQVCEIIDDGLGSEWGPCEEDTPGIINIKPEICSNYDENCDGHVDEQILDGAWTPLSRACYDGPEGTAGVGECREGLQLCLDGAWQAGCTGEVLPEYDYCLNGLDENCDGIIDEMTEEIRPIDLIFDIDWSGTMREEKDRVVQEMQGVVSLIGENADDSPHRAALVVHGHHETDICSNGCAYVAIHLTTLYDFSNQLSSLVITMGSTEPSPDSVIQITSSEDPLGLNTRPEATPYILLVGDEAPQTNMYEDIATAMEVCREQVATCEMPGCGPGNPYWTSGDSVNLVAYVDPSYMATWGTITSSVRSIVDLVENGLLGEDAPEVIQRIVCTPTE